jgi:hypothetical protein
MVDAAIQLAVCICPKAEQVAELTATLAIAWPQGESGIHRPAKWRRLR